MWILSENLASSGGACEDNKMMWLHFKMLIYKMVKLTTGEFCS